MKSKINFFNSTNLKFLALFLVFLGCLFLSDEGRKPLIYESKELLYKSAENISTFYTPKFLFNKGTYNINISFGDISANTPKIELWRQSEKLDEWQIAQNTDNFSTDFILPYDSQGVQFRIVFEDNQQSLIGNDSIEKVSITPETFFYSDTYFMIVLFLLTAIFAQLYFAKNKLTQQQIIDLCLILGIAILCTFPFFDTTIKPSSLEANVDLPYHFARIEGIKDGILDGQFGVNILPNGTENYGQLNSLYPYSFIYISALLRIFRTSLMFSYKFLLFLTNLATAISVYYSLKNVTKSRINIFLAVILYLFATHRLNSIFRAGSISQTLAMIFWPLIIAHFYNLIVKNEQKNHYLIVGFTGMIQSHILSTMMACVLSLLICIVFYKEIINKKYYIGIIKSAIIVALLNIWFIIPFVFYYFSNNADLQQLLTCRYYEVSGQFSHLIQYNNYTDSSLGLSICICIPIIIFSLIVSNKKGKSLNIRFEILLLATGLFLCFMTTGYFPNRFLQQKFNCFEKIVMSIQFPMRLLDPARTLIIFATIIALEDNDFLRNKRTAIFTILSLLSITSFMQIIQDSNKDGGNFDFEYDSANLIATRGHKQKISPQFYYVIEYNNNETNERYCKSFEKWTCYFDSNGIDFYPYPVPSLKDNVAISNFSKNGTKLDFAYTATGDNLTAEVPLQWYSGYKAFNENKQPLPIAKSTLGKIQVPLAGDGTEHRIHVQYGPIPLFIAANIISAISICGLLILLLYKKKKNANMPKLEMQEN